MRTYTLIELHSVPEERALDRFFDGKNWAFLRVVLGAMLPISAIAAIVLAAEGTPVRLAAALVDLVLVTVLLVARGTKIFEERFRAILLAYMVLQFALLLVWAGHPDLRVAAAMAIFPASFLFLRLRTLEYLFLYLVYAGTLVFLVWPGISSEVETTAGLVGRLAGMLTLPTLLLLVGMTVTVRRRRSLLGTFRVEASRERERTRMRDELHDARQIQLAMLPTTDPRLDWLELASRSIPATEVGGDFFDYFRLGDGRFAIVIGDVAGHGVGSGLVLSGIRSGLYLLRDELGDPLPVVERLDRMVRDSVRWRMFVTLSVAVFDRAERTLRVVSAGHPPLLHVRSDGGGTEEVGAHALPLGTRLPNALREERATLAPGDMVLLYTDGLSELTDPRGEPYGNRELGREVDRAARLSRATAIRDAILQDVSRYKGDAPQRDDLTLVVVKVR